MDFLKDMLHSPFFNNMRAVSFADSVIALFCALIMGFFIFFVYHKSHRKEIYSVSFGATLNIMTLISTLMMLAVSSNAVLSLGMLGALSIVRFRAAVEEPMDIAFLFWSIASGIVLAAGLIQLAVLGALFIGVVLFVFSSKNHMGPSFTVMVRCDLGSTENEVADILSRHCIKVTLKSRSLWQGQAEITFEVRLKEGDTSFMDTISFLDNVKTAMIFSNGT